MDRARLLEKIQKCLALSQSPEPHEAAAALRQAQKLMDLHNVTDRELGLAEYTSEKVSCPIQASKSGKIPENLTYLISLMQRAFGVRVTVHAEVRVSDLSWGVTYYGKADRVALAAYTHPVIYRAMDGAWHRRLKEGSSLKGVRGARTSFHIGWLLGVQKQVQDLALSDEEKKVLDEMVHEATEGREARKTNALKDYNQEALIDGVRDAKKFNLYRPIG